MKKGFTLAEIMIVLSVIAILTAILLPAARNAMPNQDVMKFKKAHNALFTIFRELTNSDKYFLNGDLGIRPNGDLIDGTRENDLSYLCEAIADNLNLKENNCKKIYDFNTSAKTSYSNICNGNLPDCGGGQACNSIYEKFDTSCKNINGRKHKWSIITQDNTLIYQSSPASVFGIKDSSGERLYKKGKDSNSFYCYVNSICIDIDGVPANATNSDCINECPFGYGLRVDGKLIPGLRAQQWLSKSIQEK